MRAMLIVFTIVLMTNSTVTADRPKLDAQQVGSLDNSWTNDAPSKSQSSESKGAEAFTAVGSFAAEGTGLEPATGCPAPEFQLHYSLFHHRPERPISYTVAYLGRLAESMAVCHVVVCFLCWLQVGYNETNCFLSTFPAPESFLPAGMGISWATTVINLAGDLF